MSDKQIAITFEQLKELLAEAKKPADPTPQQRADIEMAQNQRRVNADEVKRAAEQKRAFQNVCAHEHSRQAGGGTHAVYVREEHPASPGYILCQLCQARVRPMNSRKDDKGNWIDPNAIYDTRLFNQLFQACAATELMG